MISRTDDEIEAWQKMFEIWQVHHRLLFGMNGPQGGPHADELFLKWDYWFFKLYPTEAELNDATEWMAAKTEMFNAKWESHWAIIRERITSLRQPDEVEVARQEIVNAAHDAEIRMKHYGYKPDNGFFLARAKQLAEKLAMPEAGKEVG